MGIILKLNNLSEREMGDWLSSITREKIIIDRHPRKRSRRRSSSEETIYEYLTERKFKKIVRKFREGNIRFELYYDNKDKSKIEDIIIVIMPSDLN